MVRPSSDNTEVAQDQDDDGDGDEARRIRRGGARRARFPESRSRETTALHGAMMAVAAMTGTM